MFQPWVQCIRDRCCQETSPSGRLLWDGHSYQYVAFKSRFKMKCLINFVAIKYLSFLPYSSVLYYSLLLILPSQSHITISHPGPHYSTPTPFYDSPRQPEHPLLFSWCLPLLVSSRAKMSYDWPNTSKWFKKTKYIQTKYFYSILYKECGCFCSFSEEKNVPLLSGWCRLFEENYWFTLWDEHKLITLTDWIVNVKLMHKFLMY